MHPAYISPLWLFLVMEQTDSRKCHHHMIFIASLNHMIVADGTSRLCHIRNAASVCALDVIAKREERVRSKRYLCVLIQPCPLLLCRKNRRLLCKNILPCTFRQHIHIVLSNVEVNGVVPVCTFDARLKRKGKYLRRLTQPPVVRLGTGKSRAVDSGLLPRSDTDRLTALDIAHGIGLRVF
mgnify:CR=1 FL=1